MLEPHPNTAPPPGHPRFPLLDGARAVAALLIVLLHVTDLTALSTEHAPGPLTAPLDSGVAMFFVLSGFLLYRPFVAARLEGRAAPQVRRYLRRRVARIVPAYWLALTICGAVGWITVFNHDAWRYYGFAQNLSKWTVLGGIGPAWSLAVEASFYLALPLWALGAGRLLGGRDPRRQVRLEAMALAAVALGALVLRAIAFGSGPGAIVNLTLPAYADWFAAGMGLALASVWAASHGPPRGLVAAFWRSPALCWTTAAVVWVALSLALPLQRGFVPTSSATLAVTEHVLYIVVGFLLVLPAVTAAPGHTGIAARVFGHPLLMWLGVVSYGIFLWHHPLLEALNDAGLADAAPVPPFATLLAATLAGAIAIAAASFYLVEQPVLRLSDRRGRRRQDAPRAAPPAATAD